MAVPGENSDNEFVYKIMKMKKEKNEWRERQFLGTLAFDCFAEQISYKQLIR